MAFFGNPNSFVGIDIGTSSLKLVELVNRRRRIELATYAQASAPNILADLSVSEDEAVEKTKALLSKMMEKAGVASDTIIAALPVSAVFSTVIQMPQLPEAEMEKAVRFAARDVVPADLDEMVLGWSRVGEQPHMTTDAAETKHDRAKGAAIQRSGPTPVFLTAAPQWAINRYVAVAKALQMKLIALEVETFPLVRSLLHDPTSSGFIIDIGDLSTTFHVIDAGTPRVSHSFEFGGYHISEAIAKALSISQEEAEQKKAELGMTAEAPEAQRSATEMAVRKQVDKAMQLLKLYEEQQERSIKKAVLIGGGANLKGLKEFWASATGLQTQIGNPWRGLSYPEHLDARLQILGPTFGVAVGLALRGFTTNT